MHPGTGAVVEKLGYALPVIDDWVALCSINRTDGSADAAPRKQAPGAGSAASALRSAPAAA